MSTPSASQVAKLLRKRDREAREAPRLAHLLRGTLRRRFVRCGKPTCHCRKGRGHGPFLYLSVTLGIGRTEQITIDPDDCPLVLTYLRNYGRLHRVVEKVAAVNRELLRRRLMPRVPSEGSAVTGGGRRGKKRNKT